jgi:hypothetical protein
MLKCRNINYAVALRTKRNAACQKNSQVLYNLIEKPDSFEQSDTNLTLRSVPYAPKYLGEIW